MRARRSMLTFNNKTYAPLYACANMDNGVLDEGGLPFCTVICGP